MSALRTAAFAALGAVALHGALLAQGTKEPTSPDTKRTEVHREIRIKIGGPWLGVGIDDMDGEVKGAKVVSVADSSPASIVGLKDGDVITSFNGQTVEGAMQLRRLVKETPAGRTVTVGYTRNGVPQTATVKLAERRMIRQEFTMPDIPEIPALPEMGNFSFNFDSLSVGMLGDSNANVFWINAGSRPRLGVNTTDLEPVAGSKDGRVMITGIVDNTPAAEAGLQPGDVVLDVAGTPIHSTCDLQKALRDQKEGPVSIRIKRDCEERTINANLKKPEEIENRQEIRLNRNGREMRIYRDGGNSNLFFGVPQQMEIEINGEQLKEGGDQLKQQMEELREQMKQNGGDVDFSMRRMPQPPTPPAVNAMRDV